MTPASTAMGQHLVSRDHQDLQDSLDSQDLLVAQVLKESEDSREDLALLVPLVHLVPKVLLDSLEKKETLEKPFQSLELEERRVTPAFLAHLVCQVWMDALDVMDSLAFRVPKEHLDLCW